ncbi:hypothetical protein ACP4OV_022705 [Aristida adscensionis]
MKTFFLLGLIAIAVATAQLEESPGGESAQQCQDGGQAMDAYRDYLKRQCTASARPITWPWRWRMGSCRALRRRCCHQLEQTPETCRAIGSTVQEIQAAAGQQGSGGGGGHRQTMSKVVQEANTLPSICNMYPTYCNIPY